MVHRFRKHPPPLFFFLPLKIQPSEGMTVGHNKFLPLKIQPSEEMTMSQYFFYRTMSSPRLAEFSAVKISPGFSAVKKYWDIVISSLG